MLVFISPMLQRRAGTSKICALRPPRALYSGYWRACLFHFYLRNFDQFCYASGGNFARPKKDPFERRRSCLDSEPVEFT